MQFSYFALGDSRYSSNSRTSDDLCTDTRGDERAAQAMRRPDEQNSSRRLEDLDSRSVLPGSSAQIADALKLMEAYGFDEIILDFNVGFKSRQMVRDEMARFMAEVAPHFH